MGRQIKIIVISISALAIVLGLVWFLFPFPGDKISRYQSSTIIYDREGGILRITRSTEDNICLPVSLEGTGDWVIKAALAAEDKRFFKHPGIDPVAIIRAVGQNFLSGKIVSGASTISTLVVKLAGPYRERNIFTKLIEAFRALQMERELDKHQIITQYLNRAPFGANLVGIEAASWRYFGKYTRDLTLSESALLMGLPQSPSRLRPDRHPGEAWRRAETILDRMYRSGLITTGDYESARENIPTISFHPLPFRAPHFCDMVLKTADREVRELRTTIDPFLQNISEELLSRHAAERILKGVRGGAIVIIHIPTGEVRGMVGSPDYFASFEGQVNCARAPRSSGSTLKPFIYGLAFDRGICGPDTILSDTPILWKGYRPENFDREFRGQVTVRDAINRSLNIPALALAEKISITDILRCLRTTGLGTLSKPADYYGVSLAIGSGEVNLLDLTNAYASLGRLGQYFPYRLLKDSDCSEGRQVISREAAYIVTDILKGPGGLWSRLGNADDISRPLYAGKTGTSNGYRDAWALGFNPEYSIGVWLGNPNGEPSPSLIGVELAGPILEEIFRRIYPRGTAPGFAVPEGLKEREICSITGLPPHPQCPNRKMGYYIPGITPSQRCRYHLHHKERNHTKVELFPKSNDIHYEENMISRKPMFHSQDHVGLNPGLKLKIETPINREIFMRLNDQKSFKQMVPLMAIGGKGEDIYWFINGNPIGKTRSGEKLFWELEEGPAVIACIDTGGGSDIVRIIVKGLLPKSPWPSERLL